MWWWTWIAASFACESVSLASLASAPSPVLVVGARPGVPQDARRAARLVKRLAQRGPVTLALQLAPSDRQDALDAYASSRLTDDQLLDRLGAREHWGFEPAPYLPLLRTAKLERVKPVAVGFAPSAPPEGAPPPQPPAYIHVLADTMGEAPVPVETEARFIAAVAHVDHRTATAARDAWEERGALVVFADRLHVEGGKGVSWQLGRLLQREVPAVLLTKSDTPCYAGDLVLAWPAWP